MENTTKHDFNDLYRGAVKDFNEKQYLTELSKVRYEVKSILKKYDLLLSNDVFGADDSCIAHSDKRIDKNGAMVIEFSAGVPYNIITPYGSFPVRAPLTAGNYEHGQECKQKLITLFGLTPVAGNADMMAITKLPWQEKTQAVAEQKEINPVKPVKQSFFSRIFPWIRKTESVAQPENVAELKETPKVSIGFNSQAPVNFYSLKVKGDYYDEIATMIFHEEKHINQLLAEIDTQFIQNGHPEYMLPGDKTKYTVDGKEYMVNEISRVYTPHINQVEKTDLTEKQTTNVQTDLGQEM